MLEAIVPTADDQLVFLGDYVDRGPDSRKVIDRLIRLKESLGVVTLLGNHEEMMLRALQGKSPLGFWAMHGGAETLGSYPGSGGPDDVPQEHIDFLEACVDCHACDEFFFVHGNYVENESLDHQPAEALRWEALSQRTPGRHRTGRTAIVGHTAQKNGEVLDLGHLRCIDTYCHGGGWLTAMDVLSGQYWQADRTGRIRGE